MRVRKKTGKGKLRKLKKRKKWEKNKTKDKLSITWSGERENKREIVREVQKKKRLRQIITEYM